MRQMEMLKSTVFRSEVKSFLRGISFGQAKSGFNFECFADIISKRTAIKLEKFEMIA